MLSDGDTAPDFELPSDEGTEVRLSDLRGGPVVLYFYPRDDTSTSFYSNGRLTPLFPLSAYAGATRMSDIVVIDGNTKAV